MSVFSLRKLVPLIGITLAALPCIAQENPTTTLRFVTFPVFRSAEPVELYLGDEEEPVAIELPTNSLSEPYKLENTTRCVLGKTVTNEDGKTSFEIYGETPVLSSRDQIILVTRKGADASDGLKLTPFDGSQKGFSGGKYIMMNASTADIAGKMGKTKFLTRPNEHVLLAPEPSEIKNERKYLFVEVFFRKDDIVRPFYTSTWRFSEGARCLVFFHHDPHTKQLRTHTIRNYLEE